MPADKIIVPIPRTYQLPPEGEHQAVCVDIVDLGEVPNQRYGTIEHRVAFVFQLNELNDAGYRFEVATRFNLAMGEKALLRKFLEQLRGRPYKREELQQGPELHRLEGVNAIVTVVHATRGDRTYANIHAIRPVGTGMPAITPKDYRRVPYWPTPTNATAAASTPAKASNDVAGSLAPDPDGGHPDETEDVV